ncbi:MAG: TolC family protein [Sulfurimonas sp.]|nr:TolC family protein [Sulfurimonas sp.]
MQVNSSRSGVDIARADYLPQVSLQLEYDPTRTYVLPVNGIFNTKDSDAYFIGATLYQKIWDFSKTSSNIDAQKENIEIAKLSLSDAKAYLAYKVKLQYELIILQRAAMKVRQKDLEAKNELYKQAEALVRQGMKTSADATRFLSSFYIAKDNLAIAKASFDKAINTLSIYINEKLDSEVELESNNLDQSNNVDKQTILSSSPSLRVFKKSIRKSDLEYMSVKASHYGSLDLIASYTHQNTLNKYDSSIVGISLNIPLYSGGRTSALVEQAKINKQNLQAQYNSKLLMLKEEAESLLIDIQRYRETIISKNAQLEAAAQTSMLIEARYKEGLATYIEVLDASSLKLDAELGLLSAKYERNSAIYRLEYLEGKENE